MLAVLVTTMLSRFDYIIVYYSLSCPYHPLTYENSIKIFKNDYGVFSSVQTMLEEREVLIRIVFILLRVVGSSISILGFAPL